MLLTGATQVSKIQTQPQMFCRTHVTLLIAAGAQQLQMDKRIGWHPFKSCHAAIGSVHKHECN